MTIDVQPVDPGRIVIFRGDDGSSPAICVAVAPGSDTITLFNFGVGNVGHIEDVTYSAAGVEVGTWRWPPRIGGAPP
jgi:hypothetical protein